MARDSTFWHERFTEQARWTRQVREFLFDRARLEMAHSILEVGCGTGAVLQNLPGQVLATTRGAPAGKSPSKSGLPARTETAPYTVTHPAPAAYGLDINLDALHLAAVNAASAHFCAADAHHLPYAARSFDIVYCHFTLLWVANPAGVIAEMRRVTRAGGWVLLMAEPDYGGRIDYPPALTVLGDWQRQALRSLGADPSIGRSLGALLSAAGLNHVQSGVLSGEWQHPTLDQGALEWAVMESDLDALVAPPEAEQIAALRAIDLQARAKGERVLFVPTFYASGTV